MIAKPINSIIKKHFQGLYDAAHEKAKTDFAVNIEPRLQPLDHFKKLKFLIEESEKLDKVIEQNDHPYYSQNASSPDTLLNQYASRAFLLNVDESVQLADAIYWGAYRYHFTSLMLKLREEIPPYTYADFMAGVINQYFVHFYFYYNVTEEEYYKIRGWQSDNLIKIVSYESRMLIQQIQRHCKTIADPLQFILSEKEKIETALKHTEPIARQIKSALAQLFIFNKQKFQNFNDELLIEHFNSYKEDVINWKYIFPVYINPLLEKVNQATEPTFSNESTVFLTVSKTAEWFEAVIKGRSIQQPVTETDWHKRFNALKAEAAVKIEAIKKELNNYLHNPGLSKKQIKKYLIEQLETYRLKFNSFEKKDFFALLTEEKEPVLIQAFIANSFFGNNLDEETKSISEAIIISSIAWEICFLYQDVFETHKIDYPDKDSSHISIMSLMHQMVLDKELYEELHQSLDDFFKHFNGTGLPLEIHFQNTRVAMANVFHKSLNRLQAHLEDAEPSNKVLYLQSRLKELRQREIQMKQFEHLPEFDKKEFKYPKLFKEFLQIEADFIDATKNLNFLPALPQSRTPLALNEATETFDKLLPENKASFFLKMLDDFSITLDGKAQLSEHKKGAVRGIVKAAREKHILPQRGIDFLCRLVADKIGLEIKSKLEKSYTSDDFETKTLKYITEHFPV